MRVKLEFGKWRRRPVRRLRAFVWRYRWPLWYTAVAVVAALGEWWIGVGQGR